MRPPARQGTLVKSDTVRTMLSHEYVRILAAKVILPPPDLLETPEKEATARATRIQKRKDDLDRNSIIRALADSSEDNESTPESASSAALALNSTLNSSINSSINLTLNSSLNSTLNSTSKSAAKAAPSTGKDPIAIQDDESEDDSDDDDNDEAES